MSRQGGFNRGAVGVEAVEVSIEGIIGKREKSTPRMSAMAVDRIQSGMAYSAAG